MVTALAHFNRAKRELALAKNIDEVKDIRDKAEALRAYAKQAGESLGMQNQCAEIKLRAERRAGEMLAERPKQAGARGVGKKVELHDAIPLGDLGIELTQSHRWQRIATIPEKAFEKHIAETVASKQELTTAEMLRLAKGLRKQAKAEKKTAVPKDLPAVTERYAVYTGSLAKVGNRVADKSVNWVMTDPPYEKGSLRVFQALSRFSGRVLKPGGSLVCMVGQSYLPEVLRLLAEHLSYQWTLAYLTPGGQSAQLWQRKVNTFWKPLLWFIKGKYKGDWVGDVCRSDANDKRFHEWGQSESGMADIVERFTYPGETICDPFCGGGTTGVVAMRMHRLFVGIDSDKEAVATTLRRLAEAARA